MNFKHWLGVVYPNIRRETPKSPVLKMSDAVKHFSDINSMKTNFFPFESKKDDQENRKTNSCEVENCLLVLPSGYYFF